MAFLEPKVHFGYLVWYSSVSNGIQIHNHLVLKQTLNHLAKLAK